jgi:4-amino-4-deoxy-L-arabinose transferase-like glycosyltransferase
VISNHVMAARHPNAWTDRLEAHPRLALMLVSVIYFAVAVTLARIKTPWNDELFTVYIARRPTLRDVWDALLTGAEQLPILFYVITRGSVALLGRTHLGIRSPEIFGFWLMSIGVYVFVRRVSSSAWALVAMVFPLVTGAFYYAYEARPYALVMGFSSLALLFWQTTIRDRRRRMAAVGLGASLAAALACHYYAVLAFVPLLTAEAVRCWRRRRVDMTVAAAFLLGLAPIPLMLPLIRAAKTYATTFWAVPHWQDMYLYYQSMVCAAHQRWCHARELQDPSSSPDVASAAFTLDLLLAALPVFLAFVLIPKERKKTASDPAGRLSLPEWVATTGFALTPVLAVILAKTVTHAYADRYAMIAMIGLAPLLTLGMARASRNRPAVAPVALLIALGVFLAGSAFDARRLSRALKGYNFILSFLREESAGMPVVVTEPHIFFELSAIQENRPAPVPIRYLFDRNLALAYTGTDTVELGLIAFRGWAPLTMERFDAFAAHPQPVMLYGNPTAFSWVSRELKRRNWSIRPYASKFNVNLFLAEPPLR